MKIHFQKGRLRKNENAKTVTVDIARYSGVRGYRLLYICGVSVMNANGNERKRFDYFHIICISITLAFILCGVFLYSGALGRLIEGGRDFGLSVGYYFCEIFGIQHNITPTVNDLYSTRCRVILSTLKLGVKRRLKSKQKSTII